MQTIRLYDLLPIGKENAVSMRRLSEITGSDPRRIRQEIFNLRIDGKIIAGDSSGYYIPADKIELAQYYHTARARGKATLASIESARLALLHYESEGSR